MPEGQSANGNSNGARPAGAVSPPSSVPSLGSGQALRPPSSDSWTLAGLMLQSRVLLGTSGYPGLQSLLDCLDASGAEVVTVAVRRVDLAAPAGAESLVGALRARGVHVLPNTAGCYTAREAVLTAQLAREALSTDLVKLEVIGDDETLYPDAVQLLKAAEELIHDGFQ